MTVLPKGGIYERTDNKMLSYDFRASATYNKTFNNTHIISLYGGMSVNKIDRHNTWFRGWGLQYDMGMEPYYDYLAFKQGMESGSKYYTIGDSFYREVAFFFNGTYSYKGRYTINGTYRYEGTNKMGKSPQSPLAADVEYLRGMERPRGEVLQPRTARPVAPVAQSLLLADRRPRPVLRHQPRWPSSKPRPRGVRPAAIPKPVSRFRA